MKWTKKGMTSSSNQLYHTGETIDRNPSIYRYEHQVHDADSSFWSSESKVAFVHSLFPREVELHNSHVFHGPVSFPLVLSSCAVSWAKYPNVQVPRPDPWCIDDSWLPMMTRQKQRHQRLESTKYGTICSYSWQSRHEPRWSNPEGIRERPPRSYSVELDGLGGLEWILWGCAVERLAVDGEDLTLCTNSSNHLCNLWSVAILTFQINVNSKGLCT